MSWVGYPVEAGFLREVLQFGMSSILVDNPHHVDFPNQTDEYIINSGMRIARNENLFAQPREQFDQSSHGGGFTWWDSENCAKQR